MDPRSVRFCHAAMLGPGKRPGGQRNSQIPPGLRNGDDKYSVALEPRQAVRSPVTGPVQLEREADELSKLAQSIQRDVAQVTRGVLPKDLNTKS